VPVKTEAIGKTYPATTYAVGREKIREYASAVGETNPLYFDVDVARAAGYRDVVAPPMFVVVYAGRSLAPALFDPEVGIDFPNMLHAGQELEWGPLVVAGDEIETTFTVKSIEERSGMGFYEFVSESRNERGETVCTGIWRQIVRGVGS
jgi:acyl dehydratase